MDRRVAIDLVLDTSTGERWHLPTELTKGYEKPFREEQWFGDGVAEGEEDNMTHVIFDNRRDAGDLLALSREELAGYVLQHLRAIGGEPLKQQYSHPDNLAISIKEHYPLPFRDKIHEAIFSACKWLLNKGYLIETNSQGFFQISGEASRIAITGDMIGTPAVEFESKKQTETLESRSRVFISHSWEDKPLVLRLESKLRASGVEVWVDHRGIRAGDNMPDEISNALQWCTTLLLIWSKASSNSYWVKLEWTSALTLGKAIIPCLVDEVPLPPILSHKTYASLVNLDEGIRQLFHSLDRSHQKCETPISEQCQTGNEATKEEVQGKESSSLSSTQVKIISLLSEGPLTRSEISRRLVSLFGSETRPAVVFRELEQLLHQNLVREQQGGDSQSKLELQSKNGHSPI
jgi:hypothetical protein